MYGNSLGGLSIGHLRRVVILDEWSSCKGGRINKSDCSEVYFIEILKRKRGENTVYCFYFIKSQNTFLAIKLTNKRIQRGCKGIKIKISFCCTLVLPVIVTNKQSFSTVTNSVTIVNDRWPAINLGATIDKFSFQEEGLRTRLGLPLI